MKTKNITALIGTLTSLIKDFEKKTLKECRELLNESDAVSNLIHGNRSFNVMNYQLLDIEVEVIEHIYALRIHILKQMVLLIQQNGYESKTLQECWDDFLFAKKMDYYSFGSRTTWSDKGLSKQVYNPLCDLILKKLTEKLCSSIKKPERQHLLKMLSGVRARYNGSEPHYKHAQVLAKRFDPSNQFENDWL